MKKFVNTSTSHSRSVVPHLLLALTVLLLSACSDNPVGEDDHDLAIEDLDVTLSVVEEHVHTLSPATFEVQVRDHHGEIVTDMEQIAVERRLVGDSDWRDIEMTLSGTSFEGTYTFTTSGEYEIRVTGALHGMTDPEVMMQQEEHLHVGRAHVEAAGYRVEFENYPGHVHEGETAELRFFVLRDTGQEVTGMTAEIHCGDPDGSSETHNALEVEPGVYAAQHTFNKAGDAHAEFHFTGQGGANTDVDFHFHIAGGH